MRLELLAAALCLLPAAALWASGARRRWPCLTALGAAPALWALGLLSAQGAERALWAGLGALALGVAAYAARAVSRNAREYGAMTEALAERERRHEALSKELAGSRVRRQGIEFEQREVQALYAMVKGLADARSWEEVRPHIERAVVQYLRVEEFAFYVVPMGEGVEPYPLIRRRLSASPGTSWQSLRRALEERGMSLAVPQLLESPEKAVALPVFEAQALGAYLYARVSPSDTAPGLLARAQAFFGEIAFAFGRIRLFQEVERLSQIDGLTGVHRRAVLDRKLQEETVRAQTFKTSYCLMLLDIDHFKSLNDRYGHPFGDEVLRRVGQILKANVYETDFVARYGGEEFAILLPRAEPEGVRRKAEQVRRALEAEAFALAMEKVRVTLSIGIAHFPRDGATVEAVVRQADQALYHAKETGRNRVIDVTEVHKNA